MLDKTYHVATNTWAVSASGTHFIGRSCVQARVCAFLFGVVRRECRIFMFFIKGLLVTTAYGCL